jgi:hypothetical protein
LRPDEEDSIRTIVAKEAPGGESDRPGLVGVYPPILGVQAAWFQNADHSCPFRTQIKAAIGRTFL